MLNFDVTNKRLHKWASERPEIECLIIYGSYAQGTADDESDIDIALKVKPEPGDMDNLVNYLYNEDDWIQELEKLLNLPGKIHLKSTEMQTVRQSILQAKIIVYDRSRRV